MDSLVSAAREGVVGLIHLIFSNLEMYYGQEETAEPQVYRLQPIHTLPGCEDYMVTDAEKEEGRQDAVFKLRYTTIEKYML